MGQSAGVGPQAPRGAAAQGGRGGRRGVAAKALALWPSQRRKRGITGLGRHLLHSKMGAWINCAAPINLLILHQGVQQGSFLQANLLDLTDNRISQNSYLAASLSRRARLGAAMGRCGSRPRPCSSRRGRGLRLTGAPRCSLLGLTDAPRCSLLGRLGLGGGPLEGFLAGQPLHKDLPAPFNHTQLSPRHIDSPAHVNVP